MEELEQVCTALDLTIAPASKGKKSKVYSVVTLHLMSNTVNTMEIDLAIEMFGNVQAALDGILALRAVKTEVSTPEVVDTGAGAAGSNMNANPDMMAIPSSDELVPPPPNLNVSTVASTLNTPNSTTNNTQKGPGLFGTATNAEWLFSRLNSRRNLHICCVTFSTVTYRSF